MKYRLLSGGSATELQTEVNNSGCEPFGSPYFANGYHYQAVVAASAAISATLAESYPPTINVYVDNVLAPQKKTKD